jgi:hypothetical protein
MFDKKPPGKEMPEMHLLPPHQIRRDSLCKADHFMNTTLTANLGDDVA